MRVIFIFVFSLRLRRDRIGGLQGAEFSCRYGLAVAVCLNLVLVAAALQRPPETLNIKSNIAMPELIAPPDMDISMPERASL
jgi:hypothetical protein